MVWVQDYHLMLLPALLKNRKPKMKARSLSTCGRNSLNAWRNTDFTGELLKV